MKILLTAFALLSGINAYSAICSRTITFSDGSVLTAAQLNDEFNAAINCINGIDNANIASNAAISPTKLASTIAGDGITRNVSTGVLSVNVDDSTTEISGGEVIVKNSGISTSKLASNSVTTAKITDANVTEAKIASGAVTASKIATGAVTQAKLGSSNIASSSAFSVYTTSASYGDISGSSVSITTTGRPVHLQVVSNNTDAVGSSPEIQNCYVKFLRDSTDISGFRTSGSIYAYYLVTSFVFIDQPAAGTYTYKLQARTASGGTCGNNLHSAKLIAYEL